MVQPLHRRGWSDQRWTALYRAVPEEEFADLPTLGAFRNPEGLECEYFTRTRAQAEIYADLADRAYGDGPFVIVKTFMKTDSIFAEMCVDIEGGIEVVVVASELLPQLALYRVIGWRTV